MTNPNAVKDSLYGQAEAAEMLGVHPKTLTRYADKGYIKKRTRRCNGRPCYLGADLNRLYFLTN